MMLHFSSACVDSPQILQKQLDKWDREKQARNRLMAEVISVRKDQVQAKRLPSPSAV